MVEDYFLLTQRTQYWMEGKIKSDFAHSRVMNATKNGGTGKFSTEEST